MTSTRMWQSILRALEQFINLAVIKKSKHILALLFSWLQYRFRAPPRDLNTDGRPNLDHFSEGSCSPKPFVAGEPLKAAGDGREEIARAVIAYSIDPTGSTRASCYFEREANSPEIVPANIHNGNFADTYCDQQEQQGSQMSDIPEISVSSPERLEGNAPSDLAEPSSSGAGISEDAIPTSHSSHIYYDGNSSGQILPAGNVAVPTPESIAESTTLTLSQSCPNIGFKFEPTIPELIPRYVRKRIAEKELWTFPIAPLRTTFSRGFDVEGWSESIHPEGVRVFHNARKKLFTESDLYDPDIAELAEKACAALYDHLDQIDPDVHIVFNLTAPRDEDDSSGGICRYYLVKHDNRKVFWLDEYDASNYPIWTEVLGAFSEEHVGRLIESSYWKHCSLYPESLPWSTELVDELKDTLVTTTLDAMTSNVSMSPYSVSDLHQLLSLVSSVRKTSSGRAESSFILSRLMATFVEQRFYNFHGEPCARLGRGESVYELPENYTLYYGPLITLLSPLLFFSPHTHLRSLKKIWVDQLLHHKEFINLTSKLESEWFMVTSLDTVLLAASVAFLAIQTVDTELKWPDHSVTQCFAYVSVLSSLSSIILGLVLVRQQRNKAKETASEAVAFLIRHEHPTLGLEPLCLLWSLPFALLMWATLTFLVSILLLIFRNARNNVRGILGTYCSILAALIGWCIFTSWETREAERSFVDDIRDHLPSLSTFHCKLKLPIVWRQTSGSLHDIEMQPGLQPES